jgi:hypothetical protein
MHDEAVMTVNMLWRQFSALGRQVERSLKDSKVSALEGMMLAMAGSNLAVTIVAMLQQQTPEARNAILYVLEHGSVCLTEAMEVRP